MGLFGSAHSRSREVIYTPEERVAVGEATTDHWVKVKFHRKFFFRALLVFEFRSDSIGTALDLTKVSSPMAGEEYL